MGSYNETCVLTHTPIHYGSEVVSFKVFEGLSARKEIAMFGFPVVGQYADYGGVDSFESPDYVKFLEATFLNNPLYRKVFLTSPYGSMEEKWVARNKFALWGKESKLKHLFYSQLGLTVKDIKNYRDKPAFLAAGEALDTLGTELSLPFTATERDDFQQEMVDNLGLAFGADKAWAAYDILQRSLFTAESTLMVSKVAYDTLVATFGANKVSFYNMRGVPKRTVREFLEDQLNVFVEKTLTIEADPDCFQMRMHRESLDKEPFLRYVGYPTVDYLSASYIPWALPELPLFGHYWASASLTDILANTPRPLILDFLVFQWAVNYLRIPLMVLNNGSQNEDVKLTDTVHKAVIRQLRKDREYRADFDGTIHRKA